MYKRCNCRCCYSKCYCILQNLHIIEFCTIWVTIFERQKHELNLFSTKTRCMGVVSWSPKSTVIQLDIYLCKYTNLRNIVGKFAWMWCSIFNFSNFGKSTKLKVAMLKNVGETAEELECMGTSCLHRNCTKIALVLLSRLIKLWTLPLLCIMQCTSLLFILFALCNSWICSSSNIWNVNIFAVGSPSPFPLCFCKNIGWYFGIFGNICEYHGSAWCCTFLWETRAVSPEWGKSTKLTQILENLSWKWNFKIQLNFFFLISTWQILWNYKKRDKRQNIHNIIFI